MEKGDYVLATKYHDGDPGDHWAVGFYDESCYDGSRHHIVDGSGARFRANGFRRCEQITQEEGEYLLANQSSFSPLYYDDDGALIGKSIWHWLGEFRQSRVKQPA